MDDGGSDCEGKIVMITQALKPQTNSLEVKYVVIRNTDWTETEDNFLASVCCFYTPCDCCNEDDDGVSVSPYCHIVKCGVLFISSATLHVPLFADCESLVSFSCRYRLIALHVSHTVWFLYCHCCCHYYYRCETKMNIIRHT